YFTRVRGYIKIGYSNNPIKRESTATTDSTTKPADIERGEGSELLGWIPGNRATERHVHKQLAAHQVVGEWFTDCPAVTGVLESHPEAALMQTMPGLTVLAMHRGASRAEAVAAHGEIGADLKTALENWSIA